MLSFGLVFGACRLEAAAAAAAAFLGGGGGTAEPGARFGNLRMVLCAADLDAPEPMMIVTPGGGVCVCV